MKRVVKGALAIKKRPSDRTAVFHPCTAVSSVAYVASQQAIAASPFLGVSSLDSKGRWQQRPFFLAAASARSFLAKSAPGLAIENRRQIPDFIWNCRRILGNFDLLGLPLADQSSFGDSIGLESLLSPDPTHGLRQRCGAAGRRAASAGAGGAGPGRASTTSRGMQNSCVTVAAATGRRTRSGDRVYKCAIASS